MNQPLTVLVVDDEPCAREVIARTVIDRGHRCETASDGAEAVDRLSEHAFDVVISDWCMPAMNGLELCRHVRAHSDPANYTYFLFMTSVSERADRIVGLEAGADDFMSKPADLDELCLRMEAAERIVASQRRLRRDSESSFRLARIDALTGVGNRLRMDEDLAALASLSQRTVKPSALAVCDVDFFKRYNDTHGHLAGDAILRALADTLRHELRAGDGLYRYGGEEFVVTFPGQSVLEAAPALERLRSQVAAQCGITISAGAAELLPGRDVKAWLEAADAALYRAKSRGRDRVELG